MIFKIIAGLIISLFLLFIYCSCRVSSEADNKEEDIKDEKTL